MKLKDMNLPADIKEMNDHQLELLAAEVRGELIDAVSKTGGHLASNLGVVELTIGIHKVFDSPKDRIIWDVGHQSYIHKMLTGRAGDFSGLRQLKGISGFPKRGESPHDAYDTGHSGTSIGAASGMAAARDLKGEDYNVVAVIGDGSMTGGPVFEALNNLGNSHTKVIIVLNDNGMSISRNIGGLSEHLDKLRASSGYQTAKTRVKKAIGRVPGIGDKMTSAIGSTKDRIKYAIIKGGVVFEELGLTYLGPVDGHDIGDVITALEQAKNIRGPVIVHFITEKGKGYRPAEENPDEFHGIGPFDKETGRPLGSGCVTYSQVFGEKALALAEVNENLVCVTAAMTDATGLKSFKERYPGRLFDVGIAEAQGVIFSAGLALSGLKPIVAIYSSFLQRAYDHILEDVCLQNLPVVFCVDRAGIVGADGETHHGIFDISYFLSMPNMTLLAPSSGKQLEEMMEYALKLDSPCAIRYPRGEAHKNSVRESFTGKNIRVKEGSRVDILAVGTMLEKALKAAEILNGRGISTGVVNVGMLKPFSGDGVNAYADLLVTLEDNVESGGFGEMITCLYDSCRVLRLALPDKFIEHGSVDELYERYGLDAESIAERISGEIEGKA